MGTEPIFIRSIPETDRNRLRSFSGTDRVRMERIKFRFILENLADPFHFLSDPFQFFRLL